MQLTPHDLTIMFLSLGVLLAAARVLGELAQRLHQPSVVGEILAGILLGPTVFGSIAPQWYLALFPAAGATAVVLSGMSSLAIALFLLVAGMEVDLSTVWRQGRTALCVGSVGTVVPFAAGLTVAWLAPTTFGREPDADPFLFALFFATAISISALPIIVKILMDLNLYRSDLGMAVVAACVLNDLVGWMVFATILGLLGDSPAGAAGIGLTIAMTLGFAGFMLTIGRMLIHRILPWLQAYTHWPGGVLSFALSLALFGAAFTEWIGIHAIFGSFLVGIAIGDSSHLRERTRTTIDQFVSFIFAPLFFASIGLRVDFAANFDPWLVFAVLGLAASCKIAGCTLGALWGRMPIREALATGFTMSSVGAMGIIIGLLALQYELIRERLFVALVVMALLTSIASGPLVQWVLGRRKRLHAADFLSSRRFIPSLQGTTRRDAIHELVAAACLETSLDPEEVESAVLAREEMMHTGIGHGVAIPHARLPELAAPVVAVGLSEPGLDFDAPDGEAAHVVFLILTKEQDEGAQLEILSSIGGAFRNRRVMERALQARNVTQLLAVIRSEQRPAAHPTA